MSDETFTCAHCHQTFEKDRPDEEAHAEAEKLMIMGPREQRCSLCDDCFQKFFDWLAQNHPEAIRQ
jgi:NAD-dependent SIR2 family protein deacetylase